MRQQGPDPSRRRDPDDPERDPGEHQVRDVSDTSREPTPSASSGPPARHVAHDQEGLAESDGLADCGRNLPTKGSGAPEGHLGGGLADDGDELPLIKEHVDMSLGPVVGAKRTVTVENLVGRRASDAVSWARGAQLRPGPQAVEVHEAGWHGLVVEQDPGVGAELARGAVVTMLVGSPPPRERPAVLEASRATLRPVMPAPASSSGDWFAARMLSSDGGGPGREREAADKPSARVADDGLEHAGPNTVTEKAVNVAEGPVSPAGGTKRWVLARARRDLRIGGIARWRRRGAIAAMLMVGIVVVSHGEGGGPSVRPPSSAKAPPRETGRPGPVRRPHRRPVATPPARRRVRPVAVHRERSSPRPHPGFVARVRPLDASLSPPPMPNVKSPHFARGSREEVPDESRSMAPVPVFAPSGGEFFAP